MNFSYQVSYYTEDFGGRTVKVPLQEILSVDAKDERSALSMIYNAILQKDGTLPMPDDIFDSEELLAQLLAMGGIVKEMIETGSSRFVLTSEEMFCETAELRALRRHGKDFYRETAVYARLAEC